MNKSQKAILKRMSEYTMTPAEWELATDDFKELRKDRKMKATPEKTVTEETIVLKSPETKKPQ